MMIILKDKSWDNKTIYVLDQQGRGDYDQYQNVTWQTQTLVEFKNTIPFPLTTTQTIRDHNGQCFRPVYPADLYVVFEKTLFPPLDQI